MKNFIIISTMLILSLLNANATTWTQVSSGLADGEARLVSNHYNLVWTTISGYGIYKTTNQGNYWLSSDLGMTANEVSCFVEHQQCFFASTLDGGVFYSSNSGQSWAERNNGMENLYINTLVSCGTLLFAGSIGNGIYVTADSGQNWTSCNNGLMTDYVISMYYYGDKLFAGGFDGLYVSTNLGQSWSYVSDDINSTVKCFFAVDDKLYIGTSYQGVWVSTDTGSTWTQFNTGFSGLNVNSIAVLNNYLFAAVNNVGVYVLNQSNVWNPINNGLDFYVVNSLCAKDTFLYAATASGIYRMHQSSLNPAISTGQIADNVYYPGEIIRIPFTVTGPFNSTNVFYAQLSDSLGDFSNPTIIGSLNNRVSSTITAVIPTQQLLGNHYRVRVISSSPQTIGSDNGTDFRISWVDVWRHISNGMPPGTVTSIASKNNKIYAGTTGAGVYISNDTALTWSISNNGLLNYNITSIISVDTIIYVATYGGGIYTSNVNTDLWVPKNNGITCKLINTVYSDGTNVYVGTDSAFYVKHKDSLTWINKSIGIENVKINSIDKSNNRLVIGTNDGVFTSLSEGVVWNSLNAGLDTNYVFCVKHISNYTLAATPRGVYKVADASSQWQLVSTGLPQGGVYSISLYNGFVYVGCDNGVYYSQNNGASWQIYNDGVTDVKVQALYGYNANVFLAGTYHSGIIRRKLDETSWTLSNAGIVNAFIDCIATDGFSMLAYVRDYGLYKSTDFGNNWQKVVSQLLNYKINNVYYYYGKYFASTANGVIISTNSGATWSQPTDALIGSTVNCIINRGLVLYAATTNGVFSSTNFGETWISFSTNLSFTNVKTLFVNNDRLFAGTNGGGFYYNDISETRWHSVFSPGVDPYIATIVKSGTTLFAATKFNMYYSTNNGEYWTASENGIPYSAEIYSIGISGSNIYTGTSFGVYISTNNGQLWRPMNQGLSNIYLHCMFSYNGTVYAGSEGHGSYKITPAHVIPIPSLTQPANISINQLLTPLFTWAAQGSVTSYQLQVSTNSQFSQTIYNDNQITANQYLMQQGVLNYHTEYFWRVRGIVGGVQGEWSSTFSFTTLYQTQVINLRHGWNTISSYIQPRNTSLDTIFNNLKEKGRILVAKDGYGGFWMPSQAGSGNIQDWELKNGYQIYVNEVDSIIMQGDQVNPTDTQIEVAAGWNQVAYLLDSPVSVESATNSIASHLVLLKNDIGEMYFPMFGINNLEQNTPQNAGMMIPGKGYLIYSIALDTFIYNGLPAARTTFRETPAAKIFKFSNRSIDNATLIVNAKGIKNGSEIGAYNENGELIGSGVVDEGRAAFTIYDNEHNNNVKIVQLKVYDGVLNNLNIIDIKNILTGDICKELLYERNAVFYVNVDLEDNSSNIIIKPNPFCENLSISLKLKELSNVEIYLVNENSSTSRSIFKKYNVAPSEVNFTYKPESLESGYYTLVYNINGIVETRKIIYLK